MTVTNYSLVASDSGRFITVIIPGHPAPLATNSDNPNFAKIVEHAIKDALDHPEVDWFSPKDVIVDKFRKLTERVSVRGSTIYLDGDPIHNALTEKVLQFLEAGVEDWKPLLNYFEKVQSNPNEHSREQLYVWLDRWGGEIPITEDGDLIAYKGVTKNVDGDGEVTYASITHGPAIVDGETVDGAVPNNIGSTVEMARGDVMHNPSVGCAFGLHVGTRGYASNFAGHSGAVLKIQFNPRDVVSVPTECDAQKVRVCRYVVVGESEKLITDVVVDSFQFTLGGTDNDWAPDGEFDSNGYDSDGYNVDGYDRFGYDRDGLDPDGYDEDGLDPDGYDEDGYDERGYDRHGYDEDGNLDPNLDKTVTKSDLEGDGLNPAFSFAHTWNTIQRA